MSETLNFIEALQLAHIKKEKSNLARCYIELEAELKTANERIETKDSIIRSLSEQLNKHLSATEE